MPTPELALVVLETEWEVNLDSVTTAHKWLQLPDDTVGRYNYYDCLFTARLWARMAGLLQETGNAAFYRDRIWPMVPVLLDLQRRGLPLDNDERLKLRRQYRAQLRDTDERILFRCPAWMREPRGKSPHSLNSDQQLSKLLFDEFGLKPAGVTDKGHRQVNLESLFRVLRDLRKKDEEYRPVLEWLFHRSKLQTVMDRYLGTKPNEHGRIHPIIKGYGTKTFRLAYADPAVQQWPDLVRSQIRASLGRVLVSADYSQIEARILAYESGDEPSIECFRAGEDIHIQNAQDLFGEDQWDKFSDLQRKMGRGFGKNFLYGISYGGAAETLKAKLFCPCPECVGKAPPAMNLTPLQRKAAGERWFRRHPAVERYRQKLVMELRANRNTYRSRFSDYRRKFFAPYPECERELYNFPEQFGAACIINSAIVRAKHLPLILQHHDSLMIECPTTRAKDMGAELKFIMEDTVPEFGESFPVDVSWGENWGQMEELRV